MGKSNKKANAEVKVTASKKAMLTKKPLAKESSSEEDSSDEEPTVKPVVQGKKGQVLLAKNGSVGAVRNGKAESSDSSDSDSDEDKALELNGQELSGRPVRLDLARERGTPGVKQDWKSRDGSFSSNGSQQGQKSSTAFVRGFDKNQEEDDIRSSLMEHFADCGEIDSVRIPKDYDSGYVKGHEDYIWR